MGHENTYTCLLMLLLMLCAILVQSASVNGTSIETDGSDNSNVTREGIKHDLNTIVICAQKTDQIGPIINQLAAIGSLFFNFAPRLYIDLFRFYSSEGIQTIITIIMIISTCLHELNILLIPLMELHFFSF